MLHCRVITVEFLLKTLPINIWLWFVQVRLATSLYLTHTSFCRFVLCWYSFVVYLFFVRLCVLACAFFTCLTRVTPEVFTFTWLAYQFGCGFDCSHLTTTHIFFTSLGSIPLACPVLYISTRMLRVNVSSWLFMIESDFSTAKLKTIDSALS